MAQRYLTRRLAATAVQWNGGNLDEIREFAGEDFLHADDGLPVVRDSAGPRALEPGWWISRGDDGSPLFVHSQAAFARFWRQAPAAAPGEGPPARTTPAGGGNQPGIVIEDNQDPDCFSIRYEDDGRDECDVIHFCDWPALKAAIDRHQRERGART